MSTHHRALRPQIRIQTYAPDQPCGNLSLPYSDNILMVLWHIAAVLSCDAYLCKFLPFRGCCNCFHITSGQSLGFCYGCSKWFGKYRSVSRVYCDWIYRSELRLANTPSLSCGYLICFGDDKFSIFPASFSEEPVGERLFSMHPHFFITNFMFLWARQDCISPFGSPLVL
jgi:hypothetical protein